MPEEVAVPQGQIPEGEDKGEGVSEEWGRGHPEAGMEVHGVMGFLTPFLQDRGTTSNLQRGRVPVVEPNEEDVGSDEEGGLAAVLPDAEAGVPAPSAAAEAAVGPAAAAENRPVAAGWRGQAPEEGRGRKRRGPKMSRFE